MICGHLFSVLQRVCWAWASGGACSRATRDLERGERSWPHRRIIRAVVACPQAAQRAGIFCYSCAALGPRQRIVSVGAGLLGPLRGALLSDLQVSWGGLVLASGN